MLSLNGRLPCNQDSSTDRALNYQTLRLRRAITLTLLHSPYFIVRRAVLHSPGKQNLNIGKVITLLTTRLQTLQESDLSLSSIFHTTRSAKVVLPYNRQYGFTHQQMLAILPEILRTFLDSTEVHCIIKGAHLVANPLRNTGNRSEQS